MQAPAKTYISEVRLDMEQNLYNKAKKIIIKIPCMKSYDASRPLYLGINASGVGLKAGLLQVWGGMNCRHDKVPDIATLCPIAFTIKSLLSAEQHCSNSECKPCGYTTEV